MKKTILLFLAVVQLGMAQSPSALRAMSERGLLDSIQITKLNTLAEAEKSVLEKEKDLEVRDPILRIGYKHSFRSSLTRSEQMVHIRLQNPKWRGRIVGVLDCSFGSAPRMQSMMTAFIGLDLFRTGGYSIKELSSKNRRGNLPSKMMTHFSLIVGYKHLWVFGSDHKGFGSITSDFSLGFTPRKADGSLSPITFGAGFEIGVFTNKAAYRETYMPQYLNDDPNDWDKDFLIMYGSCYLKVTADIGLPVAKKTKRPAGHICPPVF